MPSSNRYLQHRLSLRNAQVLGIRRKVWLSQREKINALRLRELPNVGNGKTERDDRLRQAMDRLYEVRESQPIFRSLDVSISALEQLLLAAADQLDVSKDADVDGSAELFDLNSFLSSPPFPPGVSNLRQQPRRPGAPSTALPH